MFLKIVLITVFIVAIAMAGLGIKALLTKKQNLNAGSCCSSNKDNKNSVGCACSMDAEK